MSNTDTAWKTLERVNEWIRFADAKAIAILAGSGVLGGLVVRALPEWAEAKQHPWHSSLLWISLIFLAFAVLFSLAVLTPKRDVTIQHPVSAAVSELTV
jgi:hypothetical protein